MLLAGLIFFVIYIIVVASSVYLNIKMFRKNRAIIGYNIVPLLMLSVFVACYLNYIDEGGAGWKNFNSPTVWLFVIPFTSVILCLFTGLYLLVNRKPAKQ